MKKLLLGFKFIVRFIIKPSDSYFEVVQKVCLEELDKKPNDLFLMLFLADHYVQYKKYDEAHILLESLLNLGTKSKEIILLLSKAYFNLQQYKKIVDLFDEFDVLADKDIGNYYLGYSLIELGKRKEGILLLNKYIEHHPDDWIVLSLLGSQYFKEGEYDKALDSYMKAEKLNPSKKEIQGSIKKCKEKLKTQIGQC